MSHNDVQLCLLVSRGNAQAFATLFRRYYEPLCHYAFRITESGGVSEELVQELFYVLWRDRKNLAEVYAPKSYFYGAIRNRALHYVEHLYVRKKYYQTVKTGHVNDQIACSPQEEEEGKELEKRIRAILATLPLRRRRIFCMHRFEGKKYGEIADTLKLSPKTIEAEIHKAIITVKEGLKFFI